MSNGLAASLFGELLRGPLAEAIGWALVHLLWQGALIAGILAATLALLKDQSANARYLVSCGALVVLVALGVATSWHVYDPVAAPAPSLIAFPTQAGAASTFSSVGGVVSVAAVSPGVTLLRFASDHLPQVVLIWMVGVLLLSLRLVVSWISAHRMATRRSVPASAEWQRVAGRLSGALQLGRAIQLFESAAVEVPTVIGWLRPAVLLPAATLSGLSLEQMEMILAHELAHVRRNDFFVNLMQAVVETLLFYHPAVWWISGRIRLEREHCCDDAAVSVCGNPLQYARALTRLEELRVPPANAFVAANGGSLIGRIRRLAGSRAESPNSSSRWVAGAALLTILTLLLITPSWPLRARTSDAPQTPRVTPAPGKPASARIDVHGHRSSTDDDRSADEQEAMADSTDDEAMAPDAMIDPGDLDDLPEPPAPPEAAPHPPRALPHPSMAPYPGFAPFPPMAPPAAMAPRARVMTIPAMRALAAVAPAIADGVAGGMAGSMDGATRQRVRAALDAAGIDGHGALRLRVPRVRIERSHKIGAGGKLSVDDLLELRAVGITPSYIEEMQKAGLGTLSLEDLAGLRALRVSPDYLAALRKAGLAIDRADAAMALRSQQVSPEFIAAMREAGYAHLSTDDLMALRALRVDPDYVRQMAEVGYRNLSVGELQELRVTRVTPAFVKALADAGYSHLPVHELARMAAMGINAQFLRDLAKYRTH